MIYLKIKNKVFTDNQKEDIKKEYPLFYKELFAYLNIVKNTLKKELKDYPVIKQLDGNPYIVIFVTAIKWYYLKHSIKGLKQVFLHEYSHYKQWLIDGTCGHNRIVERLADNKKIDAQIESLQNYLNLTK